MKLNNKYQFLILKNKSDLIEFEKSLYIAFTKLTNSKWRKENYIIIDNNRYQSIIPYNDMIVYGIKKDNKILTAVSIRINFNEKMILEKIGFNIPEKEKSEKICEGVDFFNLIKMNLETFDILPDFFKFVLNDLKKKGLNAFYGSCENKLRLFYREAGFEFLDSIQLNGKKELLIKKVL